MLKIQEKAAGKKFGDAKAKKMQSDCEQPKVPRCGVLCARENTLNGLPKALKDAKKVRNIKCVAVARIDTHLKKPPVAPIGKHNSVKKYKELMRGDAKRLRTPDAAVPGVPAAVAKAPKLASQPLIAPRVYYEPLCCSYRRSQDVVDIDADDKENLMLVTEYVDDIYDYLFTVEAQQCVRKDHLLEQVELAPKMRGVLVNWVSEVQQEFHLFSETFYMAVAIIDMYLQAVANTKLEEFQLVGVAALFIAAKYEEVLVPSTDDFVYITDDTYRPAQLLAMERKILRVLNFNLSRPLSIHFLRRFSKAAAAENEHHVMAKYFLELCATEYELASCRPSELAAAALYLSLQLLNAAAEFAGGLDASHWSTTLQHYSRYSADHLGPLAKQIAVLARNAPKTKPSAAYNKYQTAKFLKIAKRAELYGALIDSIIDSK